MLRPGPWASIATPRLTEHREAVLTLVAHQPDLMLEEIRGTLVDRHGVTVGRGTVPRFLASHNSTLKKACTPPRCPS
jgi:hypothetical protein